METGVTNLSDLSDGLALVALASSLSGGTQIAYHHRPGTREQCLFNVNQAMVSFYQLGVSIMGISAEDIYQRKLPSIIELLALVAKRVHIDDLTYEGKYGMAALRAWLADQGYRRGVPIPSLGPSWQSGTAICVLGDAVSATQWPSIRRMTTAERCAHGLALIGQAGVPTLFDPLDLSCGLVCARSVALQAALCFAQAHHKALRGLKVVECPPPPARSFAAPPSPFTRPEPAGESTDQGRTMSI
eukprot:gnl/Trimastix_PCT/4071.p1 GENE.gnl/Trimastix_PCT/4071~~gnl/Trimastix_PCT/4071.p1  ORF type:complete len:281 (+),score=29.46 gnl/Trimastix_PCT/4071:114-845(+)